MSLVTRPTSWPCLSPSYAQPKSFHSLYTFTYPKGTLMWPCGSYHSLSLPHAPHTPSVPSCALLSRWTSCSHTHCTPACVRTPCMPLKLTLPFCSSDAPRHLHTPPHALAHPFPLIAHEAYTSTTSTTRPSMSPQWTPGSCTAGLMSHTEPCLHVLGPYTDSWGPLARLYLLHIH